MKNKDLIFPYKQSKTKIELPYFSEVIYSLFLLLSLFVGYRYSFIIGAFFLFFPTLFYVISKAIDDTHVVGVCIGETEVIFAHDFTGNNILKVTFENVKEVMFQERYFYDVHFMKEFSKFNLIIKIYDKTDLKYKDLSFGEYDQEDDFLLIIQSFKKAGFTVKKKKKKVSDFSRYSKTLSVEEKEF